MKKLKNAGRALTACVLIIALAVTFAACGKSKAEQPDLPYGLKLGQSYDEVVKVFEDKGVKFLERETTGIEKEPKAKSSLASTVLVIYTTSENTSDNIKDHRVPIDIVDLEFLHSIKVTQRIQELKCESKSYDCLQCFYFTDENKLYLFQCFLSPAFDLNELDLSEMFLYYSDLFRENCTRYSKDSYDGYTGYDEILVWENEKYFVNIPLLSEGPYVPVQLVYIGLQME